MPSVQDIIQEVTSIKAGSQDLVWLLSVAGESSRVDAVNIAHLVEGSATGMEAVQAVSSAARSLFDAALSMQQLCRICDECVENLAK